MEKLRRQLDELIAELGNETELRARLQTLVSIYPFNEYEYIISTLLGSGKLTLDQYLDMRDQYNSRNPYLDLYEMSNTRFGIHWAHAHLRELVPELTKPSKKRDPESYKHHDFYLDDNIRVEVKASRAVDSRSHKPLYAKALLSDSRRPFDMNFQQAKPSRCDVFVWIGVWLDRIRYWVLASNEVVGNQRFSNKQHNGNVGEGQLHLTQDNIREFVSYEVQGRDMPGAIREAYNRQTMGKRT